jgi:ribose-phosphate pyrophosphokinase
MINDRNFDHVVVIDPHSTVAPALIDRCFVYPMEEMWKTFWPGFSGIIAPDAGAGKRAFEVASIYKKKFLQAEKHRDVATGKLTGFACPNLKESEHYLIVDDICDGGGTFLGLGAVIEEAGAYATLFVTHGIFSQGTDKLNDTFTDVYTTDSTVFDRENVYTIRIVERMAEWATTL